MSDLHRSTEHPTHWLISTQVVDEEANQPLHKKIEHRPRQPRPQVDADHDLAPLRELGQELDPGIKIPDHHPIHAPGPVARRHRGAVPLRHGVVEAPPLEKQ